MKKKMKRQYVILYVVIIAALVLLGTVLLIATIEEVASVKNKSGYIIGPLCYIVAIFLVFVIAKKDCFKLIKQYVANHPDITMEDIENDFSKAEAMGKRVWVGECWTFYMDTLSLPDVIEHEKIVWAYFHREHHGKTSNGYIYTYDAKKVLIKVPIAHRNAKKALNLYSEKFGILVGYSKEYRKMYEEDFERFLSLRYKDR